MHRLFTLVLAILLTLPTMGSEARDSIAAESHFKAGEVVMPLTLIGAGTLGFVQPLKDARYQVRDFLEEWRGDHRTAIDDHLQYVPLGAVYGLSLLGADAKHSYVDRTLELATAYIALGGIVNAIKYTVREPRPDGSAHNSFPSGHTATTFMGAELVRIEYGNASPWYSVGAYTAAITVGVLRVYNNKHWFTDVFAGAGVGILSARIGYWLLPYTRKFMHNLTGCDAFVYPAVSDRSAAVGVSLRF
ncbi:MAG: phosphatase PAP2 family protein [Bacteroidaceae bacterium]|nr:phosphatase PAP2 family protein [Bacteroidaceae bacterium]